MSKPVISIDPSREGGGQSLSLLYVENDSIVWCAP